MTNYVYYHNPRCSKSRQGLALLEQNGTDIDIKEYLKVPLIEKEVESLFNALGLKAEVQVGRGNRRCRAAGQLHDEARQARLDRGQRLRDGQGRAAETRGRETDGVLQPIGSLRWARKLLDTVNW